MKLPRLTAEYSLGPALHSYAVAPSGISGPGVVTSMDFFSDIGSIFEKVPCLVGCGLPNALSIAGQCGLDPACWIERAPGPLAGCIQKCLQ